MTRTQFIDNVRKLSDAELLALLREVGDTLPNPFWTALMKVVVERAVADELFAEATRQIERSTTQASKYLEKVF